jgi:hypothetical protein
MQQQEGYKKYLPHLLVIIVFAVFSCAFCYPAFQGNTMNQHDIFTWLYASQESREFYKQTGENAMWANNMFGGMPQILIDYYPQTSLYHKLNQLIQFYTHGQVPNPATFFFLAMVSFYILMCTMRVNRWLGAIGALAFAFSSYNPIIISAGHTTKMLDIAFLPAIIAGLLLAYRGKYLQGAALAGLFLAFFVDSGHFQIVYYGAILIAILVVAMLVAAIKTGKLKQWGIASLVLAIGAGFALTASSARFLQTIEYNKYSSRGGSELAETKKGEASGGLDKEYAFRWSIGVGEALCAIVPDLYGGSMSENVGEDSNFGEKLSQMGVPQQQIEQLTQHAPLYWGPQQETGNMSGSVYFGAVICLLFVLSLLVIRNPLKWWLAGASLLFFFLAMGKNFPAFNYFMFDHFPVYNKFRTPSMALAIPSIIFPILGIWALRDIFSDKISREEIWKKVRIAVMITGGLCLLILIATQTSMDFKGVLDGQLAQQFGEAGPELFKALLKDRASAASSDALRSLIFVLLGGAILWAYTKEKMNKQMAIGALGLLIAVDMIPVAHRYLNERNFIDNDSYAMMFEPNAADLQIKQDKDLYYRVFDLTSSPFNDSRASNFHKSIGGYHGAKMQIYQDLIENQIGRYNSAVLNMLNTKYFIVPGEKGAPMVQKNPGAIGNAWFVSEVKWVKTAREEMDALNAPSLGNPADTAMKNFFNPVQTAVLRDTFKRLVGNYAFGKDSTANIQLTKYSPRSLTFESNNSQNGLAVFSDIYYPAGWHAKIDGKETPIMRTDYVLRALQVPAGKHVIEFSFDPPLFASSERIALFGNILLTLLILAALYVSFRKKAEPVFPEDKNAPDNAGIKK